MSSRPLKVFLCHAHADRDPVRGLYTRLTQDGVGAWLDKAKLHGERSAALSLSKCRTILPGQGFDMVSRNARRTINLPDWKLEIRKAARKSV